MTPQFDRKLSAQLDVIICDLEDERYRPLWWLLRLAKASAEASVPSFRANAKGGRS